MIPFLHNVANTYFKIYQQEISRFTFVFPNRRAGVFFQYHLSQIAQKPIFSPEVLTITDLFEKLSPYQKANRIEMLFLVYDIYIKISKSTETFDEFLYWGDMLLNDFDDVDKYLVDAEKLFSNIYDLREIDASFSYLTETQIETIKRFWENFLPVGENDKKKNFLEIWKVLFELYTNLKSQLAKKGLAYEGMLFREVIERTTVDEDFIIPFERVIFVGLNGQSKSEEKLLALLQKKGVADFYWDYSSPLVCDPTNKASFFVDKNKKLFPSQHPLETDTQDLLLHKPRLEVIGLPSAVGQAKYTHSIIESLLNNGQIVSSDKAMNTAVVLPDENMLMPTLYSIPEEIDKINVTMGYSLRNSPIAGLMEHIFKLQQSIHQSANNAGFYFRPVLAILNHRYISSIASDEVKSLKTSIVKYNKIIVSVSELQSHAIFRAIFRPIKNWQAIPDYLKEILSSLNTMMFVDSRQENEEDKEANINARSTDIEIEFVVEYYNTVINMQEIMKHSSTDMSVETYVKLLKKLVTSISVPFTGEPLSGLQIMGVLETRVLDFENVIILSMNEGIFPAKRAVNSFIPYNLRQGFDLPTYEHQDSIFAYHFYRMISRAKNIYLLYDTRTDGLQSGEVSRFYKQIKHLYAKHFDIEEKLAVYTVTSSENLNISVEKTPYIMQKMQRFLSGGGKSLSASSINYYLDCPLQFYLSVVESLTEEEEIAETIEASTFGTIFHSVIEWVYQPFAGRMVTADILKKIKNDDKYLTQIIEKSFADNYFKTDKVKALTGQNYLTGEVMRKYLKKILDTDIQIAPFIYVESERRIELDYPLPSGLSVSLKSFIDRIDEVQGHTRIIDYKTGKGVLQYRSMNELFDKEMKNRPKAVMQVFMYALLFMLKEPTKITEPGIYYLRNLFDPRFEPNVIYKPEREDKRITDFSLYCDEFKTQFDACLDEIFDAKIPFAQTSTGEACKWCNFSNICKR